MNGIKFYESKMNLNWKPIIKSIQEVCFPAFPAVRHSASQKTRGQAAAGTLMGSLDKAVLPS